MKRVRHGAVLFGALIIAVLCTGITASIAVAQHDSVEGSAPPPPPGNGVLTVRILHPTQPEDVANLPIALYALSPDGTPGYAGGQTNAEGVHEFSGISTDPGIVYLVGVHYRDIPFGERITFEAGRSEAVVELEVMVPTEDTAGVSIDELRLRVDWMGDRLRLTEILRLDHEGDRVIQLPSDDRDRSIVTRALPSNAVDFSQGPTSIGDGLALQDGRVRFWGPLYPGEQRVEYRYSVPIESDARSLSIPVELDRAASRIVVVAGTNGIQVRGDRLVASSDVQSDGGQTLSAWARAGLESGQVLELRVDLPESRQGAGFLSVPRSDVWLELDDTRMTATVEIQLAIEPGAPVGGTPDAPLLRVEIPEGATLQGVAPETEALGLIPRDDGGFDVIGPIGAGTTSVGFSYHLPTGPDGVDLGLRFPAAVETLNVLIADTGLALDSGRLHRRRPFRSGTRNYLHREAFNVAPDETIDLRLEPLRATGFSETSSLAMTVVAAVAGAFFLFAPLRTAARREFEDDSPRSRIATEREAIYTAIRDLDHDFETAKLETADYEEMREGLRAQAIELLRRERDGDAGETPVATAAQDGTTPSATPSAAPPTGSAAPTTGAFCPHCGQSVTPSWRFCSHCGGNLNPPAEASG